MGKGLAVALSLFVCLQAAGARAQDSYMNFETVPTRPTALSPDGAQLFVTNPPDNRLEIFNVTPSGLVHADSVPVGLEPVAVNALTNTEVWVVNHLSDSVSILDVSTIPARVVRTLLVGDEPQDLVFGGTKSPPSSPFPRAFISCARRGQNHPGNPKTTNFTPGIGRADVWVFDTETPGAALGGTPETIVQVFGDKPRPLAVTADGSTVYVGIFHSGNRSTAIIEDVICDGGASAGPCTIGATGSDDQPLVVPGGLPGPNQDSVGNPAPETGLIVKFNPSSGNWEDPLARNWSNAIPFSLPDEDVFAIDATATPPVETDLYATVGTTLFNMAVHPNGKLYVTNTEANNLQRFEGLGFAGSGSLRGHLAESRVTVIDPAGPTIDTRHLNKHINYGPGAVSFNGAGDKGDSVSQPLGMVFSQDGNTLYVAGFGSSKIAVYSSATIESDSFFPDGADDIAVSGGGPAGMVRDDANNRLYVYTRFDNAVKTIALGSGTEVDSQSLFSPEPPVVTEGRPFLYDAEVSSANGEAACASCHVFGNMDDLAWDLGDPSGVQVSNPNPFVPGLDPGGTVFHPLKGPMTTQTFRGMAEMGPMHWRGDRTGGNALPPVDPLDEQAGFEAFSVAFGGLLGKEDGGGNPEELNATDMTKFARFGLTIKSYPNPHRDLTNDLTSQESAGKTAFETVPADAGAITCEFCHDLERTTGHFGGSGDSSLEGEPQEFKVPHMRNLYDKVGMFGTTIGVAPPGFFGDQIRGFGVLHNGSVGGVGDFVSASIFLLTQQQRDDIGAFAMVFDTNFAPSVGQQVTLTDSPDTAVDNRIQLLRDNAQDLFEMIEVPGARECELTVKGVVAGERRGWIMDPGSGDYTDDKGNTATHGDLVTIASTPGQELTFTCVYPPGGNRIGVDRDDDGTPDGNQCGDVNGDGVVASIDSLLMRQEFAGTGSMPFPAKCNARGAPGTGPGSCDLADAAAAARRANGEPLPVLTDGCTF